MKRRQIITGLMLTLAAGVTAAITAPAEVMDNLDFFSDFELLSNLEVLEDEPAGGPVEISTGTETTGFKTPVENVKTSADTTEAL